DRRGVGGEHCLRLQRGTDAGEDLALGLLVLGCRLDDEVAGRESVDIDGRLDAGDGRLAVFLADAAGMNLAGEIAVDRGEALADAVLREVVDEDLVAGKRADMGDTIAHLTGPDDADRRNGGAHA